MLYLILKQIYLNDLKVKNITNTFSEFILTIFYKSIIFNRNTTIFKEHDRTLNLKFILIT
jgi:hypothetical protein